MSQFGSVAVVIVAFLVFLEASGQPPGPVIPEEIAVPAGHKLVATLNAKGVQTYKSVEVKPGEFKWQFVAPLADLFDGKGGKAGSHDDGPSWEASDGSKVSLVKEDKNPKKKASLNGNVDIPLLLLKVKADEGKAGTFSSVVYIQRLQTVGGQPPAGDPQPPGR